MREKWLKFSSWDIIVYCHYALQFWVVQLSFMKPVSEHLKLLLFKTSDIKKNTALCRAGTCFTQMSYSIYINILKFRTLSLLKIEFILKHSSKLKEKEKYLKPFFFFFFSLKSIAISKAHKAITVWNEMKLPVPNHGLWSS